MTEAPQKPVVIILDMAKGYGWAPGSFGYDMVARVRKLKDAAHAAGVQVTGDPARVVAQPDLDIVCELIGGIEPSRSLVLVKPVRGGARGHVKS